MSHDDALRSLLMDGQVVARCDLHGPVEDVDQATTGQCLCGSSLGYYRGACHAS